MTRKEWKRKNKKVLELAEGEGKRKDGLVMGIDVHRDVFAYCIVDEKSILRESELSNNKEGIRKLIRILLKMRVGSVAIESTAQYHLKIVYELIREDIPVLVANPQQTKNTQGKKTDKLDARRIAIAHRDGRLKPSVIPPEELFNLRKATRHKLKLIGEMTKIKQRLNQVFHNKDFYYKNLLKSKRGLEILKLVVSNRMIDEEIVKKIIGNRGANYFNDLFIKDLKKFRDKLDEVQQIDIASDLYRLELLKLTCDMQDQAVYAIAKKNKEFAKNMKILLSIPGVGPFSAAIILAEIADIGYFPSPKKLVKWAGLAPRVYQSGHKKKITGKIHKGGNKYLRRAMTLVCQNIYAKGSRNNPIKVFMLKVKKRSDSYWKAICAGARKLLSIIWYLLKRKEEWGKFNLDSEMKKQILEIINKKIRKFEGKIKKYREIQDVLSGACDEVILKLSSTIINSKSTFKMILSSV